MLNIFLTDDDEDDRLIFEEAIETVNLDISLNTFKNGMELMNYLHKENALLPDLLFLDLNMPIKNGLECLIEIKKADKLKNIIIAIYSTSSSENDIEETFVKGANIYINKPSSFKQLKKIIDKVLKINWQYQNSNLNRNTFLLRL